MATVDLSGTYLAVEFLINDFDTDIVLDISGALDTFVPSMDVSCVADLYVDLDVLKNTFKFQTDSADVTNAPADDIKYFTFRDNFWNTDPNKSFSINVADAVQDYAETELNYTPIFDASPSNKNMVAHDFVRHLANELFRTHRGVDLFNNEDELMNNIREKSQKAWAVIDNALTKWDVKDRDFTTTSVTVHGVTYEEQEELDDPGNLYGADNYKYYLNVATNNICKSILEQLAHHQPQRFREIEKIDGIQSIPFMNGDIISMKLTITPDPNQHLLVGLSAPVVPRTYKIRFNAIEGYKLASHSSDVNRAGDESANYRVFDTSTLTGGVLEVV
jgi:hypothetical protein